MSKQEEANVVDTESGNESDDGKKVSENHMVPAYMSAVMRRQFLQEMVKNLPTALQNRITVMKNTQLEYLKLESEFFKEVYELEKKYHEKYQPLYDKRKEIVAGVVDPPKEEPKWKIEEDEETVETPEEFAEVMKQFKELAADTAGLPSFWLTIFRNTELLSQMVQDHDEPVLKKLVDIKIKYDDGYSYTLEFHFDKNEYFTNTVLTKQYFLKVAVDDENPFTFDGPEIYKCKGCHIDWEKKMNLTIKTIRKKQKHKEHGAVRTIVKTVPNDSFFNFFDPPELPEDKDNIDEDVQEILATDFEIGHFLRARIIPNAVLYYTGDIIDDDDDDDEEYDEEEDEDDDDEDQQQQPAVRGGGGKKKPMPNECPNQ